MRRIIIGVTALTILMSVSAAQAQTTGRDIMTEVDERDDGTDQKSESTMRLINKRGKERVRKVKRYTKEFENETKTIINFLAPADIRGTGLLMFDYTDPDKDDDQWLYLPALKKVRRIAASGKADSFMGTDFTYDDLGDREVDEDEHTLLREETVGEFDCWVIESVPKEERSQYSKKVAWIIKDRLMTLKVDFYDRHGDLLKQMELSDFQQIDGIWTAMRNEMHNVQTNHRTVIKLENVAYNSNLSNSYFTERTLKRGRLD